MNNHAHNVNFTGVTYYFVVLEQSNVVGLKNMATMELVIPFVFRVQCVQVQVWAIKKGANFAHKLSKMTQNGIYLGLREPHFIWLNTVSLVVTNMEASEWVKCFL